MYLLVDDATIDEAARVHSIAWQASHRAFCGPEFVALHTPERQKQYLQEKINSGGRLYLLVEDVPIGVVSITGNRIEDLYILPEWQNRGYGTRLLQFAMQKCAGRPRLWVLENNGAAERLYRRLGFRPTGRTDRLAGTLREIEFALPEEPPSA